MKKLFISQPMRGKTDEEILKEREIAIEKARDVLGEDVEVLETFFDDFSADAKPLEYLARSFHIQLHIHAQFCNLAHSPNHQQNMQHLL